ncbi:MAG: adenosine deaminase [Turneriella sp.]|nr:adenosine deaminase [Turneriella sp.]
MIDLHHHFDGAFEIDALYAEAKRRNLAQGKLTESEFRKKCQVPAECRTLTEFLAVFDFFYEIAQNLDFLHNEARTLPGRMSQGGVIYLETRFAPHLFTNGAHNAADVVESVVTGLEAGNGSPVRLILCAMRNAPLAQVQELTALYEKFSARGVCGIDLAGDESRYACREYAPVFQKAAAMGIPVTIHAGEASGPESVYDALDLFKARRIGHGIRSVEDAALVKRLADENIGLEVCLTSNLQTGNATSYKDHPFLRLRQAGVLVTLNTDDPTVSGIDLNHEWKVAMKEYGFTPAERKALLRNSVAVAFCDDRLKEKLRQQIEAV